MDLASVLLWTIFALAVGLMIVLVMRSLQRHSPPQFTTQGMPGMGSTDDHVHFLGRREVATFLSNDPDGYVASMSPIDLYARQASTGAEYAQQAGKAAMEFTDAQKGALVQAAQEADRFLKRKCSLELDGAALARLPWIFAMTHAKAYEEGLPHTRMNLIFLSPSVFQGELLRTLVHEKVHLYQRAHPEEMAQVLERRGYRRWKMRMGEPRVRANPDLDPYIYIDPRTREPMVARYTSDRPSSIQDVELSNVAFEHPFETIAYQIASEA